jgi:UDP-N-acetylglucosamine acyltransferase
VGGASAVNRDVLPFAMAQGSPVRHLRANRVGLERHGYDADRRRIVDDALRLLRKREEAAFEALASRHEDVAVMRDFVASSERGVAKFVGRG